jgi:hypothetical protein
LSAWIGRVEFRNGFNPAQGFVFVAPVETACLGGNALSDRRQSRVRHDKAQFPQPSPAPPLAHHSHPFGGCSHFYFPNKWQYSHCNALRLWRQWRMEAGNFGMPAVFRILRRGLE